jgi:hypothetical protein
MGRTEAACSKVQSIIKRQETNGSPVCAGYGRNNYLWVKSVGSWTKLLLHG